MYLVRTLIIMSIMFSNYAFARMYQWTEPDTGTTQLSGKPPTWYRSQNEGPRVFVFEKGRLIDDTAVVVSEEVRQRMRQKAFILVEEDQQKVREKMIEANKLKAKFKQEQESVPETVLLKEDQETPEDFEYFKEQKSKEDNVQEEVDEEKLRELISEWEKQQTESARKSLE